MKKKKNHKRCIWMYITRRIAEFLIFFLFIYNKIHDDDDDDDNTQNPLWWLLLWWWWWWWKTQHKHEWWISSSSPFSIYMILYKNFDKRILKKKLCKKRPWRGLESLNEWMQVIFQNEKKNSALKIKIKEDFQVM